MDFCTAEPRTPFVAKEMCVVVVAKERACFRNRHRSKGETDTCGFKPLAFWDFFNLNFLMYLIVNSSNSSSVCMCMSSVVCVCMCVFMHMCVSIQQKAVTYISHLNIININVVLVPFRIYKYFLGASHRPGMAVPPVIRQLTTVSCYF